MIGLHLTRRSGTRIATGDVDANAFISAAGLTSTTHKTAVTQLVADLKSNGLWSKMQAVYPLVGGTAASHKFNLKDPRDLDAAYRLAFQGAAHSATGVDFIGDAQAANTFVLHASLRDAHLSYYSREASTAGDVCIGDYVVGSNLYLQLKNSNNESVFTAGDMQYALSTPHNGGLLVGSSTASGQSMFSNGTKTSTVNDTTNARATTSPVILGNYTTAECAFASIGTGLTDAEATSLNTLVTAYQNALSRAYVASSAAQTHINRVTADGGTVDSATVTGLFSTFTGGIIPASVATLCDPALGYKLEGGRLAKLYSVTGAAGDMVQRSGTTLPTLQTSTLNGKPGVLFDGLLQVPSLTFTNTFGIVTIYEALPDLGATLTGAMVMVTDAGNYLQLRKQFGVTKLRNVSSYQDANAILSSGSGYRRVSLGYVQNSSPYYVGTDNASTFTEESSGATVPAWSRTGALVWGGTLDGAYPTAGSNARMNTFCLLTSSDAPTRALIADYFKSYYNMAT